ncbi:hypothetical protein [Nocardia vaccinii]|uniref:hypothetical protein n=1 Tax=Nocardia vaccinii TaxID=1822 RepID=UPI000AEB9781|nr:hypothetical protein [Nocardia vaccinii]
MTFAESARAVPVGPQTGFVATGVDRALLFLDVDGTVLPYDAVDELAGEVDWSIWQQPINPALSRVSGALGERLLALGCELIWATGWAEDANLVIAPILGLPHLPVVTLPEYPEGDYFPDGLHWKTRALVDLAAGRPFIWIDDEIRDQDEKWVRGNHSGRALLHRVDGMCGLLDTDFADLADWLRGSTTAGHS